MKISEESSRLGLPRSSRSKRKQQVRIFHGFSHTTREISYDNVQRIDISGLDKVLEVNEEENYAIVEASVTMDQLVVETLKKGLIPLVVPEFPKISMGGAIQGGGGRKQFFPVWRSSRHLR